MLIDRPSPSYLKIVAYILLLIAQGTAGESAVSKAAVKFGVSEADIWAHGGF